MYILTPNLNVSLTVFKEWESVIKEAEKLVSHFYNSGYDIEVKNSSKEECDISGISCYAVYNYDHRIEIQKVIVK
jgi:hypothetical protein